MSQAPKSPRPAISIPPSYPTSLIYLDESGVATNGRLFVIGALKVRKHGALMRAVQDVRTRHDFRTEFKFTRIGRDNLRMYADLVDTLEEGDVHLGACVVDRDVVNLAKIWPAQWEAHANVAAQLLRGCINKREIVSVVMDIISAPHGKSVEDEVKQLVNRRLKNLSIATASCADSRSTNGLQLADLLAGALAWERRQVLGIDPKGSTHKGKIVERIKLVLGTDLADGRADRTNIATYQAPKPRTKAPVSHGRRRDLRVVGRAAGPTFKVPELRTEHLSG